MPTRQAINARIEAYAQAVREKDADAVAALFAEQIDHMVHGAGSDPDNPWNTKRETGREGIREIYTAFFIGASNFDVDYTDRVIDVENNAAAMVVRVRGENVSMENALQIKWSADGLITFFYNWYGQAPDAI
jgi:ketosteroid isomerase-like protein